MNHKGLDVLFLKLVSHRITQIEQSGTVFEGKAHRFGTSCCFRELFPVYLLLRPNWGVWSIISIYTLLLSHFLFKCWIHFVVFEYLGAEVTLIKNKTWMHWTSSFHSDACLIIRLLWIRASWFPLQSANQRRRAGINSSALMSPLLCFLL